MPHCTWSVSRRPKDSEESRNAVGDGGRDVQSRVTVPSYDLSSEDAVLILVIHHSPVYTSSAKSKCKNLNQLVSKWNRGIARR